MRCFPRLVLARSQSAGALSVQALVVGAGGQVIHRSVVVQASCGGRGGGRAPPSTRCYNGLILCRARLAQIVLFGGVCHAAVADAFALRAPVPAHMFGPTPGFCVFLRLRHVLWDPAPNLQNYAPGDWRATAIASPGLRLASGLVGRLLPCFSCGPLCACASRRGMRQKCVCQPFCWVFVV